MVTFLKFLTPLHFPLGADSFLLDCRLCIRVFGVQQANWKPQKMSTVSRMAKKLPNVCSLIK